MTNMNVNVAHERRQCLLLKCEYIDLTWTKIRTR